MLETREFCFFSRERYFIKAIENFFSVFANHKKTLNKDRLGNRPLQIETGRHTVPKTPENLRICPFCHLNEVEHELHFLFNCNLYDSLRSNFCRNISNRYPPFNNFDNNKKDVLHI